jgi:hypothetical protein
MLACHSNSNNPKCSPLTALKEAIDDSSKALIGDYTIYNDSIYFNQKNDTNFSYKFIADTSQLFMLSSILVYRGNDLFQEIKANKSIYLKEFRLIDWNFDGYRDISVLRECVTSGKSYWIWLYNSKKSNYIYSQELSRIWGLDQDTISNFIIQHIRAGFIEEKWDTLKFVNEKLVFVKGLYQQRYSDSKGNQWKKQIRHFNKNNKWVEVVDSTIEE